MASESIQVFVKLLSGDLISLSVDPKNGFKGIKDELYKNDPISFPISKTNIFHLDKEKDNSLHQDDILGVFVSNFSLEKNVFLYRYQETYDLFIIPLENITLYIYYKIDNGCYFNGREWHISYFVCKEDYPHIDRDQLWKYTDKCLYNAICHLYPITPEEMKEVYEIILPNVEKEMKKMIKLSEKNITFIHSVNRDEKIICECGSTVIRKSVNTHRKTKKHLDYTQESEPLIIHEQTYIDVGPSSESFRSITFESFHSKGGKELYLVDDKQIIKRKKPIVKSF